MDPARIVVEVSSAVRRLPLAEARVKKLVEATLREEGIEDAMISIAFVGRTAITRMNREYLSHSGPTDVISFGMGRETKSMPAIGDIYICPEVAARNARNLGIPPERSWCDWSSTAHSTSRVTITPTTRHD